MPPQPTQAARTVAVTSADGTRIGATLIGSGPPVVVIPGSVATGQQWRRVADAVADQRTSWLVDRRGRGLSGDTQPYSLVAEAADVVAVLTAAGPQATLVAHSFGAVVALEALRQIAEEGGTPPVSVVLYEPPLAVPVSAGDLDHLEALIAGGSVDDGLAFALKVFVGTPPDQIEKLRQSSGWPLMASLGGTWLREARALGELDRSDARYAQIAAPVSLLLGDQSPDHLHRATTQLAAQIPGSRVVRLPGQ